MSTSIAKREEELRQSIAESQGELSTAMTQLKEATVAHSGLGHFVAAYPWHWLLGAGVVGALLGLRRRTVRIMLEGDPNRWKK